MFDAVYTETLSDLITDTLLENKVFTPSELKTKTRAERITAVLPYVFENFPIFDENYRVALESKILNHFYLREIGAETPELFLYYLNRELNEQAPYFNELYRSLTFEFNPLYTVNKTINHTGSGTHANTRTDNLSETNSNNTTSNTNNHSESESSASSSGTASGTSSTGSKSGFSDTPQGAITGVENALTPNGSGYLTNVTIGSSSGQTSNNETSQSSNNSESTSTVSLSASNTGTKSNTGTQSNSATDTDSYIDTVIGYEAKPYELIKAFRDNIINVDIKIIKLLNSCFMEIY